MGVMTTQQAQALYNTLGTERAVAAHLGISTSKISPYLRSMGVVVRHRGGDWIRRKHGKGKIVANAERNHSAGDAAFRAKHTPRTPCQHGVMVEGKPLECTMPNEGQCGACKAQHNIGYYTGSGASSSWETLLVGAGR